MRRWGALLERLAVILNGQGASLPEALCAASDGNTGPDGVLRGMAEQLQAAPMCSLQGAFEAACPDWPERAALTRMFASLGRGPLQGRMLALQQGIGELSLLGESAKMRADKDAKLFQTLGWTGGACLTIFLL